MGSSNIIGESYNPLEFYPSAADLASAGGADGYTAASAELVASMGKYTVADALKDIEVNAFVAPLVKAYVEKVRQPHLVFQHIAPHAPVPLDHVLRHRPRMGCRCRAPPSFFVFY